MATRILAVLNQKGGVGKTTTCVNLGAALARRGHRVLLVDMDPQANLTVHLGLEPQRLERTSYSLLLGQHGLAAAVHETGVPGLLVVPSTLALANAEIQLASTVGRELVLREALEAWLDPAPESNALPFGSDAAARPDASDPAAPPAAPGTAGRPSADFVLIDCPPSLGTLTMNALCAAGEVLLPIQTEFFALQGVAGILESVRAVQRLNRGLRLSLVVPSLVDLRTTLARDVIDEVHTYFGDLVTKTVIRKNVKLAEAPSHGKTIFEWDARCNGARDYESLAAEVLGEPAYPDGDAPFARDAEDGTPADEADDAPPAASPPPSPPPAAAAPPQEAALREPVPPAPEAAVEEALHDAGTVEAAPVEAAAVEAAAGEAAAAEALPAETLPTEEAPTEPAPVVAAPALEAPVLDVPVLEDPIVDVPLIDDPVIDSALLSPAVTPEPAPAPARSSGISIAASYDAPRPYEAAPASGEPGDAPEPASRLPADAVPEQPAEAAEEAPRRASWWASLRRGSSGR